MSDGLAGAGMVRRAIETSPYPRLLGMSLELVERDRAIVLLPFKNEVVTLGAIVHGGALASLVDSAAVAAAWASDDLPPDARGTTIALSIQYLAAAQGTDVRAEARVSRRGRSIVFVDVDARDDKGVLVAKGQVTYKLG